VGYDSGCKEGIYCFAPVASTVTYDPGTGLPVPDWTFEAGVDLTLLHRSKDWFDMKTRVKIVGPMTAMADAWQETWSTTRIAKPTGLAYDSADPTHLLVLSGSTKCIYTLLQSDQTIAATSAALSGMVYPAGLSLDPPDAGVLWVLDAPWRIGSGSASKIYKINKTTLATLATFTLPAGQWADIKADGSVLWLANQTTGHFHSRSKADGSAIADYAVGGRTDPTGIAVDGTNLYFFFLASSAMLRVDSSAPTAVLQTISTAGTGMIGGEMDTTTGTDIYTCTDQSAGEVWKYQLKVATSNAVSVVVIAPGVIVDPEPTVPTGTLETSLVGPTNPGGMIRRLILQVDLIISLAQGAVTALAQLAKVNHFRKLVDAGIIGNPGCEKGDIVRVVDAVTGTDNYYVIDTYRSDMTGGGTYLGTLALIPIEDAL
jgi:hypothetical protein